MAGATPPAMVHGASHLSATQYGQTQPGMATRYSFEPPPTSGLGIVSMVLGILSPFFFLACGASIFTAIGAVICGHLSLLKKGDASGRAPSRGSAITGLVLGYTFLVLSPFAIYSAYQVYTGINDIQKQRAEGGTYTPKDPTGKDLLHEMEMKVVGASSGVAHGNTEQAKQLAQVFSDALLPVRDENFVGGNPKGIKLTKGKFVVCCELKEDSCVFIVHVPEFRNFTSAAKEGLADLAWLCAQETAVKEIGPKGTLAVGLKGVMLYGAVMVGTCGGDPVQREVGEVSKKEPLIALLDAALKREKETIAAGTSPPIAVSPTPKVETPPATAPPTTTPSTAPISAPPPVAYTPLPGAIGSAPPAASSAPPNSPVASDSSASSAPRVVANSSSSESSRPRDRRNSLRRQKAPEFAPSGLPAPKIEVLKSIAVAQGGLSRRGMTFSPDGKYLAAQVSDQIAVFDWKEGKLVATASWTVAELFGVGSLLFSAEDPQRIFIGGGSGAVQLWKFDPRGSLKSEAALTKQRSGITMLKARSDAKFIVGSAADGNLFWQQIKSNQPGEIRQVKGLPVTVKDIYLPDTGVDFWATDGMNLVQVDMKTETVITKAKLDGTYSFDVLFSDDGKYLATVFGSEFIVLDGKTGDMLFRYRAPESLSGAVAWLPGQERVLVSMRGGPALFDVKQGYVSQIAVGAERSLIDGICVSKDGSLVAITTNGGNEIHLASIEKPSEPAK